MTHEVGATESEGASVATKQKTMKRRRPPSLHRCASEDGRSVRSLNTRSVFSVGLKTLSAALQPAMSQSWCASEHSKTLKDNAARAARNLEPLRTLRARPRNILATRN
jgi:hypothetical protein